MAEAADNPSPRRRRRKSAGAFRTISEVARELDLPQHVLRFWETRFNAVRPMKRGGGRRYYRPDDVALLRGIRDLLYADGYTIKGVQKLLREGGGRLPDADAASQAPPAPGGAGAADAVLRAELKRVVGELEDIRRTLRGAGA
ncbi:MAG: MerR family transcriptional regulator [Rhodospirillales bacterium]